MKSLTTYLTSLTSHQKPRVAQVRKPRKKLLLGLIILIILTPLAVFLARTPRSTEAAWWQGDSPGAWLKRQRVPLTNDSSTNLSTHTTVAITLNTKELVNLGKLNNDCSDIRLLYQPNPSTSTNLDRAIVYPGNSTCATSEGTQIYFKLQAALNASATSTDYYVYYANTQATAPDNPENAYVIDSKDALLVCQFTGITTCAAAQTPSTSSGAIRYSGSKSALAFNGYDEYAAASDSASLSITKHLTVEAWVKPHKTGTEQTLIAKWDETTANDDRTYRLYITNTNYFAFSVSSDGTSGNTTTITGTSTTITTNTWYHVSGVYNPENTSLNLFVNGAPDVNAITNAPSSLDNNNSPLLIAAKKNSSGGLDTFFHGYLDEIRISNSIRYATTFTAPLNPIIRDENTQALYHFDENGSDPRAANKAIDDSGYANHATLGSSTTTTAGDPAYISGLIGANNTTTDTGKSDKQAFASHEGTFIEEETTNKITNPSFEHATFDTNWTASAGASLDTSIVKVTRVAAPTSTGTQDITTDLDGATPKAAIFIYSTADTDGTLANNAGLSLGMTDGTNQWARSTHSKDNISPSEAIPNLSTTSVIYIRADTSSWIATASFSTWLTDGVRINWSNVPSTGHFLTVVFFFGDNISSYAAVKSMGNTLDDTITVSEPGFEPDIVFTVTDGSVSNIGFGYVHNDRNSTITQHNSWIRERSGRTAAELFGAFRNDYGGNIPAGAYAADDSSRLEFSNFGSSGFDVTTRNAAAGNRSLFYLALRLGSGPDMDAKVYTYSTPTSTGNSTDTGPGFTPQAVFYATTIHETANTYYTNTLASNFGLSVITTDAQYHHVYVAEDAANPTNTMSLSDNQSINLPLHDGSTGITATFNEFTSSGVSNNFTNVTGTAKVWPALAIEAYSSSVDIDTANTNPVYIKFGSKSAKLTADGNSLYYTTLNPGNTNTHTLSAYVYNGSSGAIGGPVDATVARLYYNGEAKTTTYTNLGGGWWRLTYTAAGVNASGNYGLEIKDEKIIYLDGVQLEEKTYPTTYTDGSLSTGYSWSGTDHESSSARTKTDLLYPATTDNITAASGTVSFWLKPDWPGEDGKLHELFAVDTSAGTFRVFKDTDNNLKLYDGTNTAIKAASWQKSSWQYITASWGSNNLNVYVNASAGTAAGAFSTPTINTSGYINIGSSTSEADHANATISDLRIYDSVLTSTEVSDLYSSGLVSRNSNLEIDWYDDNKGQNPVTLWRFDEGYGTTAHDSSTYGNHLTISGATWNTQSVGANNARVKHLSFDGTNDYAYRESDRDFNFGTDGFTLSGWFKHPSTAPSSGTHTILTRYSSSGYKAYMNTSGQICFGIDDDSTWGPDDSVCSTTNVADSKWHHFTAVKDGTSTIKLYLDTIEVASTSVTATGSLNTTARLYLGIDSDGTSNPWNGWLDDFVIYPYARTPDQIRSDYLGNRLSTLYGSTNHDLLTDGLVGYWKMNETGSPSLDSSGNNGSGTWTGDTTYAAGKYGNAISLDGTGDYVSFTDSPALSPTSKISLSAWVYPVSSIATKAIVVKNESYRLVTDASGNPICQIHNGTDWQSPTTSTTALSLSSWQQVSCTYDGTSAKVFVNGNQTGASSYAEPIADNANALRIGNDSGATYGDFNGRLDEVRFYNRALPPSEIQFLFNWAPGPVGYWKLDENTGASAYDSSGNANTGTITAGTGSYTTGKFGSAYSFDSANTIINAGSGTTLDNLPSSGLSINAWIYPKGQGENSAGVILAKNVGATPSAGWLLQIAGTNALTFTVDGSTDLIKTTDNNVLSTNAWNHVMVTWDGVITTASSVLIYINGVEATYATTTNGASRVDDASSTLYIGNDSTQSRTFDGYIDDVKLYNYARTSSQIVEDMNAGHPAPGSPIGSALIHYKLDEGNQTTANNSGSAGSSLNGTITSGTWTNAGKFGKALTFSASTSSTTTITDPGYTHTISLWLKPSTSAASKTLVTSGKLTTDASSRPVYGGCTGTAMPVDEWTHLIAVSDGSGSCAIYQNGVQTATGTTGVTFGTTINIGNSSYTGDIDEFKFYTLAMTADQAKVEFNQGQAQVWGATSTDSTNAASNSASDEYCPPGQGTACVGPIAEWKFDENTGTDNTYDTSGNGYTGTLAASPSWVPGKFGSALKFNGSDQFVSATTSNVYANTYTASFWFKTTTTALQQLLDAQELSNRAPLHVVIGITTPGRVWATIRDNTGTIINSDTGAANVFNDGKWHYAVVKRVGADSGTVSMEIIIDGISYNKVSNTLATTSTNGNFYIGKRHQDSTESRFFNGSIDNVRIYNYARTPAQDAWEFNRGAAQWNLKLDQTSGSTAYDSGPVAKNGTLQGNAVFNTTSGACKFGYCVTLDGTDDYISTANFSPLVAATKTTTQASWGGWYYLTSSGASKALLEKATELKLTTDASSKAVCDIYTSSAFTTNTASATNPALTLASWHHLLCTYDGTTIKLFVNGTQADSWSQSGTITATSTAAYAGSSSTGSGDVEGRLDDQYIFNYPLTPQQIQTLQNQGTIRVSN